MAEFGHTEVAVFRQQLFSANNPLISFLIAISIITPCYIIYLPISFFGTLVAN